MTRRPRRAAAATVLVLAVTGLSACTPSEDTGFDFATDKVKADNAAGRTASGGILASALVLVKSKDAVAAALAGSLLNRGETADTLESVVLTPVGNAAASAITVTPNLVLQPGVVYPLGTPGNAPITVPNAQALKLGHFVDVRLHFRTGGDIKVQVETHKREGFYSEVLPEVSTPATQADVTRGSKGKTNTLSGAKKGSAATETATTTSKAGTTTPEARAATRASKRAAAERAAAAKAARTGAANEKTTAPAATQPAGTAPAATHPTGH